eukprot:TRINITY_DN3648_c0_g1_i1.p1 TRINITY_DN3648_c0_g1~~TRINITY_DN3648_c0_g1_i1.p1  ORF type:complete len:250 (+),score=48.15 TRINITY_DN3648_c0_g1_i1:22-750(+)
MKSFNKYNNNSVYILLVLCTLCLCIDQAESRSFMSFRPSPIKNFMKNFKFFNDNPFYFSYNDQKYNHEHSSNIDTYEENYNKDINVYIPYADIYETESGFVIVTSLPGIETEPFIEVNQENQLTITANINDYTSILFQSSNEQEQEQIYNNKKQLIITDENDDDITDEHLIYVEGETDTTENIPSYTTILSELPLKGRYERKFSILTNNIDVDSIYAKNQGQGIYTIHIQKTHPQTKKIKIL